MVEPLPKFRTPETVARYPPLKAGEYLMSMTVNAFRYLQDARAKGVIRLDYAVPEENPFKREAREIAAE